MVRESFETGSMPQIHVSLGALQASHPRRPGVRDGVGRLTVSCQVRERLLPTVA